MILFITGVCFLVALLALIPAGYWYYQGIQADIHLKDRQALRANAERIRILSDTKRVNRPRNELQRIVERLER